MGATCARCIGTKIKVASNAPKVSTLLRCDFMQSHALVTVDDIMDYGCYVLVRDAEKSELSLLSRMQSGSPLWIATGMTDHSSLASFLQAQHLSEDAKFSKKQLAEIRDTECFSLKKSTDGRQVTLVLAATPGEIFEKVDASPGQLNKFGMTVARLDRYQCAAKQCFMLYAEYDAKKREARLGGQTLLKSLTYLKQNCHKNNRVIVGVGQREKVLFCDESRQRWLQNVPKASQDTDAYVQMLSEFVATGMPLMDDTVAIERPVLVCGPEGCQVVDAVQMGEDEATTLESVSSSNRTYDAPSPVTCDGAIFKHARTVRIASFHPTKSMKDRHLLQFDQLGVTMSDLAMWTLT